MVRHSCSDGTQPEHTVTTVSQGAAGLIKNPRNKSKTKQDLGIGRPDGIIHILILDGADACHETFWAAEARESFVFVLFSVFLFLLGLILQGTQEIYNKGEQWITIASKEGRSLNQKKNLLATNQ